MRGHSFVSSFVSACNSAADNTLLAAPRLVSRRRALHGGVFPLTEPFRLPGSPRFTGSRQVGKIGQVVKVPC